MIDIEKNYEQYITLLRNVNRPGVEKLINWLDSSDAKIAPSSTKFHLSVAGGLIQHSLNVYYRLVKLLTDEGIIDNYSEETIILVALCHDLCKVNYYERVMKSKKELDQNKQTVLLANGKPKWVEYSGYEIREDKMVYGLHAENSVYILNKLMTITYEEMLAIRWHMGCLDWQDAQSHVGTMSSAYAKSPLAMFLHFADRIASTLDEDTNDVIIKPHNNK